MGGTDSALRPTGAPAAARHPPPGPQRRLTVFFRLPLLVPHFVVLFFLHIAAWFATIATWFAALATARVPDPLYRFLAGYLGWATRVDAEAMLLVDRYPPFALHAPGYPVRVEVTGDRLNRLAVLFRLILLIPALIVQALASSGWWVLGLIWWLIVLVMGRVPQPSSRRPPPSCASACAPARTP